MVNWKAEDAERRLLSAVLAAHNPKVSSRRLISFLSCLAEVLTSVARGLAFSHIAIH